MHTSETMCFRSAIIWYPGVSCRKLSPYQGKCSSLRFSYTSPSLSVQYDGVSSTGTLYKSALIGWQLYDRLKSCFKYSFKDLQCVAYQPDWPINHTLAVELRYRLYFSVGIFMPFGQSWGCF
ncbi:unnamed protein product [Strongylus vulgaris]|uniref:Uncharacterized protein n=1 Tax=Strongylus vulgaris TaxID=40348 RepID=A0A3P7JL71_STRVU|nr:unnamed protein product [Strongylus vulgaris]